MALVIAGGIYFCRVGSYFTRFEDETDVMRYLNENLEIGVSTEEEVYILLEDHLDTPNFCDEIRDYPLANEYDEILTCAFMARPSWRGAIYSSWYGISFYFNNDILGDIEVFSENVAP